MVRRLDQVQWAFSGSFGESEANVATEVSDEICSWASFNQVLHMRNKYRNRLDKNKTGGNAIRLKLTNLQPAL